MGGEAVMVIVNMVHCRLPALLVVPDGSLLRKPLIRQKL